MRVAVLNGVNLDVLERRDPELYGGLTLNQLETRIYAWAQELELLADCIEPNRADRDFFIRKAIGWALRSYAWTDAGLPVSR